MMSTLLLNGFVGLYLSFSDLKSFNWLKSLNSVVTGYLNPKSVTNMCNMEIIDFTKIF